MEKAVIIKFEDLCLKKADGSFFEQSLVLSDEMVCREQFVDKETQACICAEFDDQPVQTAIKIGQIPKGKTCYITDKEIIAGESRLRPGFICYKQNSCFCRSQEKSVPYIQCKENQLCISVSSEKLECVEITEETNFVCKKEPCICASKVAPGCQLQAR